MVVDHFQVGHNADHDTARQCSPDAELCRSQFHVEATCVDDVPLSYVLTSGQATGSEPLSHLWAETHESQGDEEGRDDGHDEHDSAEADVEEETQERRFLLFVGQSRKPVYLDDTDETDEEGRENGIVAERRVRGDYVEGAVLLAPLAVDEQCTVVAARRERGINGNSSGE